MEGLARWDVETFRAVHVGLRREWLDGIMHWITDMGLSHAQILALIIVALRPKLPVWAIVFFVAVVAVADCVIEQRLTIGLAFFACLALFWLLPQRIAWGAVIAGAATGILRLGVEAMINRQRPSNYAWADPMEPVFGHSSFPSGHSTTSFAIAVFLLWALREDELKTLAPAVLLWALLIGFSRIYIGVHYPTDVMGGLLMGIIGGTAMWLIWVRKAANSPTEHTA